MSVLDELEHERADAVRLLEPMDRRDVRMVGRGEDARLPLEARAAIGIFREGARQDLDDVAASLLSRARYLTHAAGASWRQNLMQSQTTADFHTVGAASRAWKLY